jgi:ATPase subunit of ABC transporter with duplicated ATPase domains
VLDEPTNHLDLESIEALVAALKRYEGTLIFVSHDRWFVGELAGRIVEVKPGEILDYRGSYEEYVHYCGDDHLDADTVVLKAREERRRGKERASSEDSRAPVSKNQRRQLETRRDKIIARIEAAEERIGEINEIFCDPGFYDRSGADEVRELEAEQADLRVRIEKLTRDWESAEEELTALSAR